MLKHPHLSEEGSVFSAGKRLGNFSTTCLPVLRVLPEPWPRANKQVVLLWSTIVSTQGKQDTSSQASAVMHTPVFVSASYLNRCNHWSIGSTDCLRGGGVQCVVILR